MSPAIIVEEALSAAVSGPTRHFSPALLLLYARRMDQPATSASRSCGPRIAGPMAHVGVAVSVLLAQPIGNAPLVEALEEARHVAILLEREGVPAHVAG